MKKVQVIEATKTLQIKEGNKPKLRVAAYCRVSTSNLEQISSYQAQKDHYLKTINSNPEWELVDIYADEGISGTSKDKRSEFLRLIGDCEQMKIDLVITKSISRFARNTADCIETVRKLKTLGIAVYFEKENINTMSAESELILSILSSIAAEESKSISQNLKWSHQKRAQAGKQFFLKPLFIIFAPLTVVGLVCWFLQLTNLNNFNIWGLYIIGFMPFTGVAAGSLIFTSSAYLFQGMKEYKPCLACRSYDFSL